MKQHKGLWIVIGAIVFGMTVGVLTQKGHVYAGIEPYAYLYPVYALGGQLFINALMLLVVPLVASSIMAGVARIGGEQSFGRLGAKTFGLYLTTNLLGILVGLFFVNLFQPGSVIPPEAVSSAANTASVSSASGLNLGDILLKIIPSNIVATLAQGQMLGIIFFSLLFGYCISKIDKINSVLLVNFVQGIFQAMIQLTHLIMKFLPVGVFFLVAKIFAETGLGSLVSLGWFTVTVVVSLLVFMLIVLPLLLKIGGISPRRHFAAMGSALITAFSTSSSAATLPVTMDCVEQRAGVSNKICSLVVPLATSLNLSGSAVYVCVASLFVAQAYHVDLSFMTQAMIVLIAFVTSVGVAGVPSASLVSIIAILHALGIPAEGIGLFIAVDRVLDMCRTTVSVFSGSCCAVLVAKTEGEKILV